MADAPSKQKKSAGGGRLNLPIEAIIIVIALVLLASQVYVVVVMGVEDILSNVYMSRFIFVIKIISGMLIAFSAGGIVYVATQTAAMQPVLMEKKNRTSGEEAEEAEEEVKTEFQGEWARLREKLTAAGDDEAPLLIIEADSIVDRVLRHLGIAGDTMGERLKAISTPDFKARDDLWDAHRVRNQIAHGDLASVRYVDALYAIEKYERALKELGVLSNVL